MYCPMKFMKPFSFATTDEDRDKDLAEAKETTWGCEGSRCAWWEWTGEWDAEGRRVNEGQCSLSRKGQVFAGPVVE